MGSPASRFLDELPEAHVVRERADAPADPAEARESGRAQLARLREMLGR